MEILINKNLIKKTKGLSHTPKSLKNIHRMIRLGQLKSLHPDKEKKGANVSSNTFEIKDFIPIYEIIVNDITIDISNSIQYIRNSFAKLGNVKNATVWKIENGFKYQFPIN